jgi:penicillin-binding protein 1A
MTWKDIMVYAHQGIELRPLPGLAPQAPQAAARGAPVTQARGTGEVAQRPPLLTRRGADILMKLEQIMDEATRALAARDAPGRRADADGDAASPVPQGTVASATDRQPGGAIRGN